MTKLKQNFRCADVTDNVIIHIVCIMRVGTGDDVCFPAFSMSPVI